MPSARHGHRFIVEGEGFGVEKLTSQAEGTLWSVDRARGTPIARGSELRGRPVPKANPTKGTARAKAAGTKG